MAKKNPRKNPGNLPPAAAPAPSASFSSPLVAELKAKYEELLEKVQAVAREGIKLEQRLLQEVKEKVKAHAGDLEALKAQKAAAAIALNQAEAAEKARAEADKLLAATAK